MAGTSHLTIGLSSVSIYTSHHHPHTRTLSNHPIITNKTTKTTTKSTTHGPRTVGSIQIRAMTPSFGSRLADSVKQTLRNNPVVVYSKTWCSYSSEVKSLFKRLGVQPLVVELDRLGPQGPQLQKVLERLTGQHTVPNVFIGGKHVGGCTDTLKLYRKGELEPLLSEASARKTEN